MTQIAQQLVCCPTLKLHFDARTLLVDPYLAAQHAVRMYGARQRASS